MPLYSSASLEHGSSGDLLEPRLVSSSSLLGEQHSGPPPVPFLSSEFYRDHTLLHEGRHSTVWSAIDPTGDKGEMVVIKSYCKARMKERHAHHVVRETRLLQLFRDTRCRGVVQLRHAYEDDDCVHLVFEPCMRGDLYQLMTKQNGRLQEDFVACQVIAPLLSTLAFLHEMGIVHRDVKTENIFLTASGEMQLGDFGLVAHKQHDLLMDRVGTLDYMAPEVLSMPLSDDERGGGGSGGSGECRQPYDEKVDIWAVGVLLYELLVGRPPFEVEDPVETAQLILTAQVTDFPAHLPHDCVGFIQTALARNPADRPSAADLTHHAWLQRHLQAAAVHAAASAAHAHAHAHVSLRSRDSRPPSRGSDAGNPSPLLNAPHSDLDILSLAQLIDDAWKIDELERVMSKLAVPCAPPEPPPLGALAADSRSGRSGGDASASDPASGPSASSCCLNPAGHAADTDQAVGGAAAAAAHHGGAAATAATCGARPPSHGSDMPSPGSVLAARPCLAGNIHSPKTPGPSSQGDSPVRSPASPGAWARAAREGLNHLRAASYQVLGKDLAQSAATCRYASPSNVGSGGAGSGARSAGPGGRQWATTGRISADAEGMDISRGPTFSQRSYPCLSSSLSLGYWESDGGTGGTGGVGGTGSTAGSAGGTGGGLGGGGVAGVAPSSRSFTECASSLGGGGSGAGDVGCRSADASVVGTPAWQRAQQPVKAAGRSRFAS